MAEPILALYINKWNLTREGASFRTNSSLMQPCVYDGLKAMLKIPFIEEELRASKLLQWWDGKAATKVLKVDSKAILLERIENENNISLINLVKQGQDNEATSIICQTANKLHSSHGKELPPLISLMDWFGPLLNETNFSDEILKQAASVASRLLSDQTECRVLHGDLHHENILYSDVNGWVAIDPKALYGDRAFDFANILCNPNKYVALDKDRLVQQIEVIGQETNIDFDRMLNWVIAWLGLSAIWMEEDHLDASFPIQLAKIALSIKK
jgi:streptomycin 6-kinase